MLRASNPLPAQGHELYSEKGCALQWPVVLQTIGGLIPWLMVTYINLLSVPIWQLCIFFEEWSVSGTKFQIEIGVFLLFLYVNVVFYFAGTSFLCSVLIAPVRNEEGTAVMYIVNHEDVTWSPNKDEVTLPSMTQISDNL